VDPALFLSSHNIDASIDFAAACPTPVPKVRVMLSTPQLVIWAILARF
jgi:hypothetical protein